MIVTVQLEEHDVLAAGGDTWPITRAILEAIEPGAGGHCVARIHTEAGGLVTQHHRLGVTIEIVPAPLAVAPPWPMVVGPLIDCETVSHPLPHLPHEMGNMGGHKR